MAAEGTDIYLMFNVAPQQINIQTTVKNIIFAHLMSNLKPTAASWKEVSHCNSDFSFYLHFSICKSLYCFFPF